MPSLKKPRAPLRTLFNTMIKDTTKPLVSFKNVTKSFSLQQDKTIKELVPSLLSGSSWKKVHTAFSSLSFSMAAGETVGIIGKNGAGKSTIMKLIAGVTQPTKGRVTVRGNVTPLIELGAGFHHELTGVENVYLSSAILGMHKKQIDLAFDSIVDFSGISTEYLHTPIKRYSSGMMMRLAFATAVHIPADIYLMDEILAVGDVEFQSKCINKLKMIKQTKNSLIVFVSHDQDAVTDFCDRALYLKDGELIMDDTPNQVFKKYGQELEDE